MGSFSKQFLDTATVVVVIGKIRTKPQAKLGSFGEVDTWSVQAGYPLVGLN